MNAIEKYVPVMLFIMLYKVVLTLKSVDEILQCDHSNCLLCCTRWFLLFSLWIKSYIVSIQTVYYAVQGGSNS